MWNTKDSLLEVHVGDTLRIYNEDSVNHQLHTSGKPCEHGTQMKPGESYDCKIETEFNSLSGAKVYDHLYGPEAVFWLRAVK